jgi:hypothetical protein
VEFDDALWKDLKEISKDMFLPMKGLLVDIAKDYSRTEEEKRIDQEGLRRAWQNGIDAVYGKLPDIKPRTDGKILPFRQTGGA